MVPAASSRCGRSFIYAAAVLKVIPEQIQWVCDENKVAFRLISPMTIKKTVGELAAGGLRVIAVAQRRLTPQQAEAIRDDPDDIADFCRDGLTLTGFLGLSDTPRFDEGGV